nr:Imm26 family immunity protein [Massilia rubra]
MPTRLKKPNSVAAAAELIQGEVMGWWNAPENPDLTVGDTVLDLTRRFLIDFSREYQEDLSRKPTLQELEYALNLGFKVNLDDEIVSGFEELEVKQVTIKTAKRAKRQKAKPGDIFAYKLDDGRWGFGRIVIKMSIGALAEFFDYTANQPAFDYSKIDTWLVPPITISPYTLFEGQVEGDWRIIGHTPDFTPDERYKDLRFVYGDPVWMAVDIFGKSESVSAAVAQKYPSYSARGDRNVKDDIAAYLAGKPI